MKAFQEGLYENVRSYPLSKMRNMSYFHSTFAFAAQHNFPFPFLWFKCQCLFKSVKGNAVPYVDICI